MELGIRGRKLRIPFTRTHKVSNSSLVITWVPTAHKKTLDSRYQPLRGLRCEAFPGG